MDSMLKKFGKDLDHLNLDEEKKVDKELAALAESAVNMQAI